MDNQIKLPTDGTCHSIAACEAEATRQHTEKMEAALKKQAQDFIVWLQEYGMSPVLINMLKKQYGVE